MSNEEHVSALGCMGGGDRFRIRGGGLVDGGCPDDFCVEEDDD
jgi:hypothetical protein